MDSEGIDFPIGMMVIKGEYQTQDEMAWKKKGYVFEYYRRCHFLQGVPMNYGNTFQQWEA